MEKELDSAIQQNKDIIWDQTNLSVKHRKEKLKKFETYHKIAVYFSTAYDVVRPGKTIPNHIVEQMMRSIEIPTRKEGFEEIITI